MNTDQTDQRRFISENPLNPCHSSRLTRVSESERVRVLLGWVTFLSLFFRSHVVIQDAFI